jgi:hypothetical protein
VEQRADLRGLPPWRRAGSPPVFGSAHARLRGGRGEEQGERSAEIGGDALQVVAAAGVIDGRRRGIHAVEGKHAPDLRTCERCGYADG